MEQAEPQGSAPKKPRLVFTDLQRRTLQAIFKVSKTELVSKSLIITFLFPHVFHSDKNILSLCVDCCYNSPAGVCIV